MFSSVVTFTFIIDLGITFCVVWSKGQGNLIFSFEGNWFSTIYWKDYSFPTVPQGVWNLFLEYLFCPIIRLSVVFFFFFGLSITLY